MLGELLPLCKQRTAECKYLNQSSTSRFSCHYFREILFSRLSWLVLLDKMYYPISKVTLIIWGPCSLHGALNHRKKERERVRKRRKKGERKGSSFTAQSCLLTTSGNGGGSWEMKWMAREEQCWRYGKTPQGLLLAEGYQSVQSPLNNSTWIQGELHKYSTYV